MANTNEVRRYASLTGSRFRMRDANREAVRCILRGQAQRLLRVGGVGSWLEVMLEMVANGVVDEEEAQVGAWLDEEHAQGWREYTGTGVEGMATVAVYGDEISGNGRMSEEDSAVISTSVTTLA